MEHESLMQIVRRKLAQFNTMIDSYRQNSHFLFQGYGTNKVKSMIIPIPNLQTVRRLAVSSMGKLM